MFITKRGNFVQQYLQYTKNRSFLIRQCSTGAFLQYDKDPAPFFIDQKVQKLLKSMTGLDFAKIFKKRSSTDRVNLKFMTPEELESQVKSAAWRARQLLQMPPIVKVYEDHIRVLSKDALLDGFADSKYVITDISFDVKDTKRTIVIRHEDGTLETAPMSVRKRMNQIYFPRDDRKLTDPLMFTPEYLQRVLDDHQYEFILDRACIQYEPYEKEYHEITSKTYQHLNSTKRFHDLRSTRHFGTMAFFLAWHKMIDDLLLDCIKRGYLRNAVELVLLYYKLHAVPEENSVEKFLEANPDQRDVAKEYYSSMISGANDDIHQKIDYNTEKTKEEIARDEHFLKIIEDFTKSHGVKKILLELAVQTYREELEKRLDNRQTASS